MTRAQEITTKCPISVICAVNECRASRVLIHYRKPLTQLDFLAALWLIIKNLMRSDNLFSKYEMREALKYYIILFQDFKIKGDIFVLLQMVAKGIEVRLGLDLSHSILAEL